MKRAAVAAAGLALLVGCSGSGDASKDIPKESVTPSVSATPAPDVSSDISVGPSLAPNVGTVTGDASGEFVLSRSGGVTVTVQYGVTISEPEVAQLEGCRNARSAPPRTYVKVEVKNTSGTYTSLGPLTSYASDGVPHVIAPLGDAVGAWLEGVAPPLDSACQNALTTAALSANARNGIQPGTSAITYGQLEGSVPVVRVTEGDAEMVKQ